MSVAMMAPLSLPAARHVGFNSIRRRRRRAMAVYFAVYLGIWVGFGALVLGLVELARQVLGLEGRVLLAPLLLVAAAWQLTRWKRRALYACKRTVALPPVGFRADAGCARFGLKHGWRCLSSCWALMATAALVHHWGLVWMGVLTIFVVIEEMTLAGRRLRVPAAGALAGAAVVLVAL